MTPWIQIAGWTLVHFVWQGAVLALIAALSLRLLRRASPQWRYGVACAVLAGMLVSPVITAHVLSTSAPAVTDNRFARTAPLRQERRIPAMSAAPHETAPVHSDLSAEAVRQWVNRFLPVVVSIWLCGVGLLLVRLGGGWWRVRRLHRTSLLATASRWQAVSERIAARLHLQRGIQVVDSVIVDTPTVVGWLRPVVLLPVAALANLTSAQVEAILAHELAHVRRHDYLVNTIQTVAETVLFYHPGVWWVSNRIRVEREHCCDDVALEVCGDAVGYAGALAELETSRTQRTVQPALALAATGGPLLERVRRMLRVPADDDQRSSHVMFTVSLALLLIVAAGGMKQLPAWQAPAGSRRLAFEVASIKVNGSGESVLMRLQIQQGGRMNVTNAPLRMLIRNAYRLQEFQIVGGPEWLASERFDIVAKAEGNPTSDQLIVMLRTLLAERFKLAVHNETRDLPIYELVATRSDRHFGPQLRTAAFDCAALRNGPPPPSPGPAQAGQFPDCGFRVGPGTMTARGVTVQALAMSLSTWVNRVVLDRTGLTGDVDLDLKWTPDQMPAALPAGVTFPPIDPNGPSIFTALQEQLGLKLESTKGPVEVLVIDKAEKPSEE